MRAGPTRRAGNATGWRSSREAAWGKRAPPPPARDHDPAVWNASMLFFQTTLLAGYLYAHESTRQLGVRRQAALHVGVLLLPLLVLPLGVPDDWIPPASANPVLALLGLLVVAVG